MVPIKTTQVAIIGVMGTLLTIYVLVGLIHIVLKGREVNARLNEEYDDAIDVWTTRCKDDMLSPEERLKRITSKTCDDVYSRMTRHHMDAVTEAVVNEAHDLSGLKWLSSFTLLRALLQWFLWSASSSLGFVMCVILILIVLQFVYMGPCKKMFISCKEECDIYRDNKRTYTTLLG
jgi:hypothetical protein